MGLIERIKVCWHVLTKRNYVFFVVGKSALLFDEGGKYIGVNSNKVACYSNTGKKLYNTNAGLKPFGYLFWLAVEAFAQLQISKNNFNN